MALYLGELNDSQRAEWQRAVEALGDDALLLGALGLMLPAQPPPKISGNAAPQETEV